MSAEPTNLTVYTRSLVPLSSGGGGSAVDSVFGRTGNVSAATGDYNFTQISGTVSATQLPLFTASVNGAVTASGGGTTNFLRADGTWAAPPGSGGPAGNITVGATTVISGTSGRVLYDNAGILGEYTPVQLTAQIQLFTSTLSGAVAASGGGTANFLRADGTWAAPPGSGGTVSSVALTVPTGLAVAGSPITSSGTFAVTWSGTIPAAQRPSIIPTIRRFTSGSGTYTPAAGLSWIRVRMVAGGGGGAGAGNGGTGGNTTFGGWTTVGGTGGTASPNTTDGGAGGTGGGGGTNGTGTLVARVTGGWGMDGQINRISGGNVATTNMGGSSFWGGDGVRRSDASVNSGAGGGTGYVLGTQGGGPGSGGAGEYAEFLMTSAQIGASLSYAVGAAGTAGVSGATQEVGTAGGAGIIIVEEMY